MSTTVYQSVSQTRNPVGWVSLQDTQYTVGSPLAILANTPTVLPCNKLGPMTVKYLMSTDVWNSSTNTFFPEGNNTAYQMRVSFTITPAANGAVLDVATQSAGFTDLQTSMLLSKGNGVPMQVVFSWPFLVQGQFLLTNGGQVIINCSQDAQIYNIRIAFVRVSN